MKFRRHESGGSEQKKADGLAPLEDVQEGEATDFASLTRSPSVPLSTELESLRQEVASQRQRPKQEAPTDFLTLKTGLPDGPKPYQSRSATDYLVDLLTPLMILIMVWSFLFYLLDIRYVYSEVLSGTLRWVAFFFVLGIVALNRLIARDGKDESIMYMFGLAAAIGIFTVTSAGAYNLGSVAPTFLNRPGIALAFNMTAVAFLWWVVNRLTHECCVDENYSAGDVGILTGTLREVRKSMQPVEKKKSIEDELTLRPFDPTEWKEPEKKVKPKTPLVAADRLQKRHPGISIFYVSVPVMVVFALGQRVTLHGGIVMELSGHFYLGCYTFSALSLLMLTSLGGLREYFRKRHVRLPGALGPFWVGLGYTMIFMVMFGAVVLPGPGKPPVAHVSEHIFDPYKKGSTFQLQDVVNPGVKAGLWIQQNRVVEFIGYAVLGLFGLFLVYGAIRGVGVVAARIARKRHKYPQWVVRLFDWLDRTLARFAQLPVLPKFRITPDRIDRDVSESARFTNPLSSPVPKSPKQLVETSYDALCALAADLGVPRHPDQTPYEFIESFPKRMDTLREEARELTELYVQSAYSPTELDPRTEDRLRRFWLAYEAARGRVVR